MKRNIFVFAFLLLLIIPFSVSAQKTVTVGLEGDVLSMDPHVYVETITNAVQQHIYEGLCLTDSDLQNIPGLAERWELSDDLLTWTFYLREGVRFHNGNPFTADDVLYSFDRANEPFSKYIDSFANVESYEKLDDYTILVKFSLPDVVFLSKIRNVMIMDKETFEGKGEDFIALNPNGTGKYVLEEYVREDHITLVKNNNYWGDMPEIEKVIYKPIANNATRTANILSGAVDLIVNVPVADVEILRKNEKINIIEQDSIKNIYLLMAACTDNPSVDSPAPIISPKGDNPFRSLKVRQAMYHAINMDEIVEKIMRGFATPSANFAPEGFVGYNPNLKRLEYNPELAIQLLDEAGYPVQTEGELKGYRFQVTLDAPNDRYVGDAQIAQAIAGYFAKVGIKLNLNLMSRTIFYTYIRANNNTMGDMTHFLMTGWSDSSGEALTMARDLLYSNSQSGWMKVGYGEINRGYYQNEEIDQLIDKASATKDKEERDQIVQKIWQIAADDVAFIPLHFEVDLFATNNRIKYHPRPDKFVFAWDIELID